MEGSRFVSLNEDEVNDLIVESVTTLNVVNNHKRRKK